jgi:hypothetical protein
MRFSKVDIKY